MFKRSFILSSFIILLAILACQDVPKGSQTAPPNKESADLVRYPVVAGTFYPDGFQDLMNIINGFFKGVPEQKVPGKLVALIAPHAGYIYSGPVAAYGFKLLQGKGYETVIVLGPSHRIHFKGGAVYPGGKWRTPLGDVEIDRELAREIIESSKHFHSNSAVHAQEHSLEVEIPFLQATLKDFKLVPIEIGSCNLGDCHEMAEGILKTVQKKNVLLVASTDMSHYYPYDIAKRIDDLAIKDLESFDIQRLWNHIERGEIIRSSSITDWDNTFKKNPYIELCGSRPTIMTLLVARRLGADKVQILKYANSGDTAGDKRQVVGYVSCAITKPQIGGGKGMLNEKQQKELLKLARNTIKSYLERGEKPDFSIDDPDLKNIQGAFVTLHKKGQLRGCIGNIIGQKPLYITVRDMAIEAATGDPRFNPVKSEELDDIDIEISVLSPLEKVKNADEIELGTHGVIVRRGYHQGVFLPQVATETGWSKEEFLSHLCSGKAGLPANAWKDPNTELYIFSAQVFGEKDLSK